MGVVAIAVMRKDFYLLISQIPRVCVGTNEHSHLGNPSPPDLVNPFPKCAGQWNYPKSHIPPRKNKKNVKY